MSDVRMQITTKTLDLGCGSKPRNLFNMDEIFGVDIKNNSNPNIVNADLAIEPIPFPDNFFDSVTAFDFIEHIPRVIYNPNRRFCFVELMNEIYRVLKVGGIFCSSTPAYPAPEAFTDPTHVNIITDQTFPVYFDDVHRFAAMYGYSGYFKIENQQRSESQSHLITFMKKVIPVT